ncbi:ABC transporter permease [Ferruginibacter lapsinanis]|uniref:ABC transporter permease n=1 Tax=Ferruginibacter lapsinanis TaxID=563172 RepID=UPI001E4EF640|nr:ABC transporter permease [Ferruginibacter lapsinanis]UEG50108.1 ABC transporter permease [Ferruginibacter lapsinanis]
MIKNISIKIALSVFYFVAGMGILVAIWAWISKSTKGEIPSPLATWDVFKEVIQNPMQNDPDITGIGTKLLSSLKRVGIGFGLGSLIAIPLGFMMGASKIAMNIVNPIVQILRPVSPLAWFPLGLAIFQDSPQASVFMIFICCIWPTLINTSFGVASIPADHKNVSKAFGFSTWKYITKVMLPYSLPHIFTGLRLSVGIAWMVIVAGEMLSGGQGLGYFVWEEGFNGGSVGKILVAIIIIGVVGLVLDKLFTILQKRFSYAV